jgi:hypothetical protein
LGTVHCKLFTFLDFWCQLLLLFSPAVDEKDTTTVPVVPLSENMPAKTKTQSECLEDELDLDLELDIANVVSISTRNVTVCLVTHFEVLSFIILPHFEFKLL